MVKNCTWDELHEKYIRLIAFAAHKEFDRMSRYYADTSVTKDDLVQIGIIKLMECCERYGDLEEEDFTRVFQRSLFRAVRRALKSSYATEDIDEITDLSVRYPDDCETELLYNEGVKNLINSLDSPIAKAILHEMIEPSPRTIFHVWADRVRKETVYNQGKKINLAKTSEVRLKHISKSLGITQKQMDMALLEIREKAKFAFDLR